MKLMLLAGVLLFASTSAMSDEIKEMYMANDAGGHVVLTSEKCAVDTIKKDYPYRAYATESSELVKHEGCWNSPDTSDVPNTIVAASEGAPPAPTLRIIPMVITWWQEGGSATFLQSNFTPSKHNVAKGK